MNFVFIVIIFNILEYSAFEYDILNHKDGDFTKDNMGLLSKETALPTANLKLNVFDKMLSDEMLSIKQYFHERDSSHTPSVRITVQAIAATPTLEVKQKWPIKHLFLNSWSSNNNSEIFMNDEVKQMAKNLIQNETSTLHTNAVYSKEIGGINQIKDKVVELRSLPKTRMMRICDCMKTNPEHTCTHRCTGMDDSKITNICKHTTNDIKHECTRTSEDISTYQTYPIYPIYVTYPAYFWGLSTYAEKPYYHPNPVNEIKISKTKKRNNIKKPRPFIEESFHEMFQDNERYDNSMENYVNSMEIYDEDPNNWPKRKSTIKNVASVKNDENKYTKTLPKKLEFVNKDSFVNDIVEDLKEYYGDIVLKDCYCSLSPRHYILNIIIYVIVSFVHIYFY